MAFLKKGATAKTHAKIDFTLRALFDATTIGGLT